MNSICNLYISFLCLESRLNKEIKDANLPFDMLDFCILDFVTGKTHTPGSLARSFGSEISSKNFNYRLKKLEDLKLLKRASNEYDQRSNLLSITAAGAKAFESIKKVIPDVTSSVFSCIAYAQEFLEETDRE